MPDPAKPTILDRLSTDLLRILPQHLLAAGMYRLARATTPSLKDLLISQVVRRYGVISARRNSRIHPSSELQRLFHPRP